jgi:hypothetical protein
LFNSSRPPGFERQRQPTGERLSRSVRQKREPDLPISLPATAREAKGMIGKPQRHQLGHLGGRAEKYSRPGRGQVEKRNLERGTAEQNLRSFDHVVSAQAPPVEGEYVAHRSTFLASVGLTEGAGEAMVSSPSGAWQSLTLPTRRSFHYYSNVE